MPPTVLTSSLLRACVLQPIDLIEFRLELSVPDTSAAWNSDAGSSHDFSEENVRRFAPERQINMHKRQFSHESLCEAFRFSHVLFVV